MRKKTKIYQNKDCNSGRSSWKWVGFVVFTNKQKWNNTKQSYSSVHRIEGGVYSSVLQINKEGGAIFSNCKVEKMRK